ncbi:MAG: hypothetical protein RR557_07805 [Bacilli bacterium]
MREKEILILLDLIIGQTSATGSHGTDMDKVVHNVEKLGQVTTELVSKLQEIATSWENREESSIKAVGKKARYWVDFIEVEVLDVVKRSEEE